MLLFEIVNAENIGETDLMNKMCFLRIYEILTFEILILNWIISGYYIPFDDILIKLI